MHRWTPIVAGIALVAAALLPAVPIDASHSKWEIHDSAGPSGDTYVFKLQSDEDFTIKQGSTIGLSATYDEKRRDMAFAFAWTDLDGQNFQRVGFDTDRNGHETDVKVLSDTSHGIEYNDSKSDGDPLTPGSLGKGFTFVRDVEFEAGTWYFIVSAPEATEMGISVLLDLDQGLSIADEAEAVTGTVHGEDDFDGTAQAKYAPVGLVAAEMEVTAQVPDGMRAFAAFGPEDKTAGAGHWGIDGPGDADDEALTVSEDPLDGTRVGPRRATILDGPAGEYRFWVDAEGWASPHWYGSGDRVAVLYGAPIPL